MSDVPSGLEYWTADEIAECLDVPDEIYVKLWGLAACEGGKPLGGDEGWEWPELVDSFANQPNHFWPLFSEEEQDAIAAAYLRYQGEV